MRLRYLLPLLVIILVAWDYLDWRFGYSTYRVDDWCLRFKTSEVEWPHGNPFIHSTSPFFFVRAPIPYEGAGAPSDQGFVVYYWKRSAIERQHLIDEDGSLRWGCNIRKAPHGLVELYEGDGRCFPSAYSRRYELEEKTGIDAAVNISCSKIPTVKNCKINNVMRNGWEARISLPKASLSDWRVATSGARKFFEEKLQDCGT